MKLFLKLSLLILLPVFAYSQQSVPDSLRRVLQHATTDSVRHNTCVKLYFYYQEVNRDSALFYTEKRLALAKQNNYKLAEAAALIGIGYQYAQMGKYAASYQNLLLALKIAKDPNNEEKNGWRIAQIPVSGKDRLSILALTHHGLSVLMRDTENPKQEIYHLKEALRIARQNNYIDRQMLANMNMSIAYLKMNQLDSALYFAKEADIFSKNPKYRGIYRGINIANIGDIYLKKGDKKLAKKYYYEGLSLSNEKNNQSGIAQINHALVQFFLKENEKDSALSYVVKNIGIIKSIRTESVEMNIGIAYEDAYLAYKLNNQLDSAYKYQGLALVAKDSFYKIRIKNLADFQNLSLEETMRLENLEKEKIQTQSKIRTYAMLSVLAVLSIIGFILYRNNRQKQKANQVLETTLTNLKSTQSQLIQSEKMASLGELTAGIAHEIQNPLNFVNNFSEVNTELIDELKEERKKEVRDFKNEDDILNDIKENEQKINHHGKRADAIVKGMLQHSRSSSGVKEPTNINALADEYLRLAYHGLRAKDKSFNVTMKTDYDETIGNINIIPQDIGRAILNLITNAFYATNEKAKLDFDIYEPIVTVKTSKIIQANGNNEKVEISVADNGNGIPLKVLDKIFQPFFTTKPTGQGTGLGLSLSYDIVKAHGGELKVETKEGEGSEFIINLNIK
jgi:two-component system, NtrC family, sensor kinase